MSWEQILLSLCFTTPNYFILIYVVDPRFLLHYLQS